MNHDLFKSIGTLILCDGKIDNRPQSLAKINVLGIFYQAHNLEDCFRFVGRGLATNPQSDSIRALSKSSCKLLIDDCDLRGCGGVFLVKVAARQQRNTERFEKALTNPVEIRVE